MTGIEAAYPLRFDRSSMALQLASDGEGVVLESTTLAIKELKEGTLVPFSPAFPVIRLPAYWIVCPHRHLNWRIVTIFADWMMEEGKVHEKEARAILDATGSPIVDASTIEGALIP